MALTEAEKRDLTAAGWQEGRQAAANSEPDEYNFSEAGVEGSTIEDVYGLDYHEAEEVLTAAAFDGEQNARQMAGHPTYEITATYGDPDRDEYDIEEAYELYEAGVNKGIESGILKRLGPEDKWGRELGHSALGAIRRRGPGKFETILDSYLWEISLDGGADKEAGYEEGGGWFGAMYFDAGMLASLHNTAGDNNDKLTQDEADEILKNYGVIMFERSDGIVEVAWYDKQTDLEADWNRVLEDVYGPEDAASFGGV